MTEREFLMWVPHAQAWLRRINLKTRGTPYGLELRIRRRGRLGIEMMIQTPDFVTPFDPLTAVASLVARRNYYHVSNWRQAAHDLKLSEKTAHRITDASYCEPEHDPILRRKLIVAIS